MKRFAIALAVLALVAPMVLGLRPSTASAGTIYKGASINIHPSAQLVTTPTGPAVAVTVTYNCAPTSTDPSGTAGTVVIFVDQNAIHGQGSQPATCDDRSHTTTVTVLGAFTQGPANASAFLTNYYGSAYVEVIGAEIKIK